MTAAAVTAGLGWFVSGALSAALTNFVPILPSSVIQLVFPPTVPRASWYLDAPWHVLLPLLSTVTFVGLLVLLIDRVLARPVGDSGIAFFALWLCSVLATFITSLLWALGVLIVSWPPIRIAFLLEDFGATLLAGSYWGIIWGWLPALMAVRALHDPQRTVRPIALPLMATAAIAVMFVGSAPATLDTQIAQPAPAPTEEPVVYGSPPTADISESVGADWCRDDQLRIKPGTPDSATGHRVLVVTVLNTSGAPCVIDFYPDIAFDDATGWAMDVFPVRGGSFLTEDAGRSAFTLQPGGAATSAIGWNAMATSQSSPAGTLLVAPYAGATRQSFPVELDIITGSSVSVTAWQPLG